MASEEVKTEANVKMEPEPELKIEDGPLSSSQPNNVPGANADAKSEAIQPIAQSLIPGLPPPSPQMQATLTSPVPQQSDTEVQSGSMPGDDMKAEVMLENPTSVVKAEPDIASSESHHIDVPMIDAALLISTSAPTSDNATSISAPISADVEPLREDGSFMAFNADFIEAARANRDDLGAEFAEDSDFEDDAISSDTSDSDSDESSSDSGDDDSDTEFMSMNPEEAARMLMRAGSEEGGGTTHPPRTANEQGEKPGPIRTIENIARLPIKPLGQVFNVVAEEKCVTIRATARPDHNVLQIGAALCLEDRTLIRPTSDVIATVMDPYYVVYFESMDEIKNFGLETGVTVCYIDDENYREYVFYEDLKNQKFTDASNINDEEVDDREREYSDDEEEAAHKKMIKERRRERWEQNNPDKVEGEGDRARSSRQQHARPDRNRRGRGGGSHPGGRYDPSQYDRPRTFGDGATAPSATYSSQSGGALNYDDDDVAVAPATSAATEGYTPLQRPGDYGTWTELPPPLTNVRPGSRDGDLGRPRSSGGPSDYVPPRSYANPRGERRDQDRGRGRGRGRGNRSDRGGRRDNDRGGYRNNNRHNDSTSYHSNNNSSTSYQAPVPYQAGVLQTTQMNFAPPPPPGWTAGQTAYSFQPQAQTQGNFQTHWTPQAPPTWNDGSQYPTPGQPYYTPQQTNVPQFGQGQVCGSSGSGFNVGAQQQHNGGFRGFQSGGTEQQYQQDNRDYQHRGFQNSGYQS